MSLRLSPRKKSLIAAVCGINIVMVKVRPSSNNLGDLWASICHCVQKSKDSKEKVELYFATDCEYVQAQEVFGLLEDTASVELILTDSSDFWSLPQIDFCEAFNCHYSRTKVKWAKNNSKIICYQFDPSSAAMSKSCDLNSMSVFFGEMETKRRYRLVDVGHRCPLQAAVHLLSIAEAFIGVESGLSHVAFSVGTPAFVLANWSPPHWVLNCAFKGKPVVIYRNVDAFLSHKSWLEDYTSNVGKILEPKIRLLQ